MEWSSSDRFCFEAFQCFLQSWSNHTHGWHPGAQSGLPHAVGKLLGWFCRGQWREDTSENPESLQFMVFIKEIGLNALPFWVWFVWTYACLQRLQTSLISLTCMSVCIRHHPTLDNRGWRVWFFSGTRWLANKPTDTRCCWLELLSNQSPSWLIEL